LAIKEHQLDGLKQKYLVSAGKPMPNSRVRIVDENDNPLGPGEYGEICAKGKHIMMGYWKNQKLTEAVLKGGWYHTGDMGYMDQDGYIFMTDRKADMIISGGENVSEGMEVGIYLHPRKGMRRCFSARCKIAKWCRPLSCSIRGKEATPRRSSNTARSSSRDTSVPRRWLSGTIFPKKHRQIVKKRHQKENSGRQKRKSVEYYYKQGGYICARSCR
jgi:hypothetical protein